MSGLFFRNPLDQASASTLGCLTVGRKRRYAAFVARKASAVREKRCAGVHGAGLSMLFSPPQKSNALCGAIGVQLPAPFDCAVVAVVSTLPSSIATDSTHRPSILATSFMNRSRS
jgi:hypothetical protein